jgi:hypothetical protein
VLPLLSRQNRHGVRTIGVCRKRYSCVMFGGSRLRRTVDRIEPLDVWLTGIIGFSISHAMVPAGVVHRSLCWGLFFTIP